MQKLNPIDYQYWLRWWETNPQNINGLNGKNLRPPEYRYQEAVKQVATLLQVQPKDTILDVGCGTGMMMALLAPMSKHVTGIDKFAYLLETAQAVLTEAKVTDKCTLLQGDAIDIQQPKESFDKVLSIAVIQYIHADFMEKYVNDLLFVTKKGGKVLIGDIIPLNAPKFADANVTMIPESYWDNWFDFKPKIVPSVFEDRYHVVLTK